MKMTLAKNPSPRVLSPVLPIGIIPVALWFIIRPFLDPVPAVPALYASFGFSLFALLATLYLIPALSTTFENANLKGRDLLKSYDDWMYVFMNSARRFTNRLQSRKLRTRLRSSLCPPSDPIHPLLVLPRVCR